MGLQFSLPSSFPRTTLFLLFWCPSKSIQLIHYNSSLDAIIRASGYPNPPKNPFTPCTGLTRFEPTKPQLSIVKTRPKNPKPLPQNYIEEKKKETSGENEIGEWSFLVDFWIPNLVFRDDSQSNIADEGSDDNKDRNRMCVKAIHNFCVQVESSGRFKTSSANASLRHDAFVIRLVCQSYAKCNSTAENNIHRG